MDVIGVYETVTGARVDTVPASSWSWRRQVSGAGALSVSVPMSLDTQGMGLRQLLAPWRTTLAVVDTSSRRVVAAGVVYARRWDADSGVLDVSCADLWDALTMRLALSPSLDGFTDGALESAGGRLPGAWTMTLSGSLADIARGLVAQTLRSGPLPVVLPAVTGGTHERTYLGADFATVASRLSELTQVIGRSGDYLRPAPGW